MFWGFWWWWVGGGGCGSKPWSLEPLITCAIDSQPNLYPLLWRQLAASVRQQASGRLLAGCWQLPAACRSKLPTGLPEGGLYNATSADLDRPRPSRTFADPTGHQWTTTDFQYQIWQIPSNLPAHLGPISARPRAPDRSFDKVRVRTSRSRDRISQAECAVERRTPQSHPN